MSQLFPVTVKDVEVHRRGARLIGPVDLTLENRGITVVLGPNGAGKTTLLRAMHGIERINGGSVIWAVPPEVARLKQAYVFQTPIMMRRSVADNLAYPLKLRGAPKAEIADQVALWAERIGLADALGRSAPQLSGGEKQKLALARALVASPDVLFLDEPCANLDGRSMREIEALLIGARDAGVGILMTTHDLGQCKRLAEDIVFIIKGRVHETGAAAAFLEGPRTAEAKAFLRGDIIE
ncbi:ABC transporter ATP-binding protein [Litoreibacter roseus]|uniref:ABC transporter ATP-binding protein n=1 Tax=Litoreibacter roseus TaxID=2601869 RepID=A0A6N6JCC7_9RHOB|nr:ABC transporter ATP-binding protein [Litoreibacter roseus]